jgi:hypothetical protein
MSKDYWVTVPVDCHVTVIVHADSEEEAKEKALETDVSLDIKGAELEHFKLMRQVNTGNVCHITQWEIEAEEQ